LLGSGEDVWGHALGMALIVAGLKLDADSRLAALLFAVPAQGTWPAQIEKDFGTGVAQLVDGISRLNRMRPITRGFVAHSVDSSEKNPQEMKAQIEVLRKMLLAMVEDIRVVLLRLASRTQTLRHLPVSPMNCASRWRARRWRSIRRWPTGSASGN
jgi:GTP pyrophosphokinase